MGTKVSQLGNAGTLSGAEIVPVSRLSATVTITATTISAAASDNSFNDSGSGFITAGFAVGDQVRVQGFTGNAANNIFSATVTARTAGKLTIGGADGDVIVDDAAGESVTITKWESVRTDVATVGGAAPVFSVKSYGARGDGRVLTDVGTTNADATVTSASGAFTAGDVGKVFEVTNNATVFRSTIASINSSTSIELAATVTFTATNCTAHFGTDDSAEIQAAIDAAGAAGGGTVFFPRGIYIVNGALQDTSRSNAQLLLPRINTTGGAPITVSLIGEVAPAPIPSVAAAVALPRGGVIIKGTLNTTGGTSPALIGSHGPSGSAADFSNAHVVVKNLTIRMPGNPVLTALDLSHMACAEVDAVVIDSGQYHVQDITEPTTTSSYGLVMPKQSNGKHSVIGSCDVIGFYWGYQFAEHCNGVNVNAWGCKRAFEFSGLTHHASVFQRLMAVHCEQVLVAGGGEHRLQIQQLNVEHATSGWWVTDFDVNDSSNRLVGDLRWHVVLAGTGNDATFTVSGASKLRRRRVGADRVQALTDATNIATNCDLGTSFRVTLGGNRTLDNPTGLQDGEAYNWRITQDGTGSRTLAYGSKFKFAGGAPTLSTAAGAKDFISCQYDATDDTLYCAIAKAMA